jgi:hypothetical protein
MDGETHYGVHLTCEEKEDMLRWYLERLRKKEICFIHPGHICMGSTKDLDCIKCWREHK